MYVIKSRYLIVGISFVYSFLLTQIIITSDNKSKNLSVRLGIGMGSWGSENAYIVIFNKIY